VIKDNIGSVWSVVKTERKEELEQQAHKQFYEYITEFGEIDLRDPDLYENIADLICEKKKLSKTQIVNS
jgi:hypothetical protein